MRDIFLSTCCGFWRHADGRCNWGGAIAQFYFMNADFFDAHSRHWNDAELLFLNGRWANADHLYGIAAECGLKRIMLAFGMPVSSSSGSPVDRQDKVHADAIWVRFESYRSGHHQGAGYVLPDPSPFQDWKVEQRYAHQGDIGENRAKSHQAGANVVYELLKQAQLDGLIDNVDI